MGNNLCSGSRKCEPSNGDQLLARGPLDGPPALRLLVFPPSTYPFARQALGPLVFPPSGSRPFLSALLVRSDVTPSGVQALRTIRLVALPGFWPVCLGQALARRLALLRRILPQGSLHSRPWLCAS